MRRATFSHSRLPVTHCAPLYVHFRLPARLLLYVTRPCASICRHFPSPRALSLLANRRRPCNLLSFFVLCYCLVPRRIFRPFAVLVFTFRRYCLPYCVVFLSTPRALPYLYAVSVRPPCRRPLCTTSAVRSRPFLPRFALFIARFSLVFAARMAFCARQVVSFAHAVARFLTNVCKFFVKHLTFFGGGYNRKYR